MIPTIKVTHDLPDFKQRLTKREKRDLPRVMTQAINRTGQQGQSAAIKIVAKETGLVQKLVRTVVKLRKARFRRLQATIEAEGRFFNLIHFAARQTKKGVSAKPWGKRRVFPSTFTAYGGATVSKRKGKERGPIAGVYGPNPARTFGRRRTLDQVEKVIRARWPINLRQAMRRFFRR